MLPGVDRLLAHTPARSSPASTSRSPGVSGGPDSGGSGGPARAARTADGWNMRVGGVRMLVTSQSAEAAAKLPVAALVMEGATNREIAARLFVSVKTVEATLTRVYRKLGIRSRVDIVRLAAGRRPD